MSDLLLMIKSFLSTVWEYWGPLHKEDAGIIFLAMATILAIIIIINIIHYKRRK